MIYHIANSYLNVEVDSKGAELQSIRANDGTEYLWQGNPKYWKDRALTIFPYIARLTEDSYYLDGERYQMNIHGLAPYFDFACVENNETSLVLEMVDSPDTLIQYPRKFAFRVTYQLEQNLLSVLYTVENHDDKTIYFGVGGHPGFNVPLVAGRKFEDYRLRFSEEHIPVRVGFSDTCYLNGQDMPYLLENSTTIPLCHNLFNQDAVVFRSTATTVTLECENDPHAVTVSFPQMPYLGIWHMPKTDAPYVCIEPWSSLPSRENIIEDFSQQESLISLPAQETYQNTWTMLFCW